MWVHASDGSTVGRFSKKFGMDVHKSISEQQLGASQCLHCTHAAAGPKEWMTFIDLMQKHYGSDVPYSLIHFD